MFMITPLEGSASSVGYSRWHFFANNPFSSSLLRHDNQETKTQNAFISVAISTNGRSCALSCCIVHWNSPAMLLRGIYYTSASLFDAWPPSALLMAPFCCAALIIQGVPPDFKYQNKQQITQPTKSFSFTLKIS